MNKIDNKHKWVFVNGDLIAKSKARLGFDDRGFRFGDGAFETVMVRDGAPYLWEKHIRRLKSGLQELRFERDVTADLHNMAVEIIDKNQLGNGLLKIIISRGEGSIGYLPKADIQPAIFIETTDLPSSYCEFSEISSKSSFPRTHSCGRRESLLINDDELAESKRDSRLHGNDEDGDKQLCIANNTRPNPASQPTKYKLIQSMSSVLARLQAEENNCFDALQLSHDKKYISECSSANIFWIKGNDIFTPDLSTGCVGGTIRERLLEIIPNKAKIGRFSFKKLLKADGVIITNSGYLIQPIDGFLGYETSWHKSTSFAYKLRMSLEQDMAVDG